MKQLSALCTLLLLAPCPACFSREKPKPESAPAQAQEQGVADEATTRGGVKGGEVSYLSKYATPANGKEVLEDIIAENSAVIVDFYADWCGPCKRLGKYLEDTAGKFPTVIFVKVNVDTFKAVASAHSIQSIPVILFYRDGKQVLRETGTSIISHMTNEINKLLLS